MPRIVCSDKHGLIDAEAHFQMGTTVWSWRLKKVPVIHWVSDSHKKRVCKARTKPQLRSNSTLYQLTIAKIVLDVRDEMMWWHVSWDINDITNANHYIETSGASRHCNPIKSTAFLFSMAAKRHELNSQFKTHLNLQHKRLYRLCWPTKTLTVSGSRNDYPAAQSLLINVYQCVQSPNTIISVTSYEGHQILQSSELNSWQKWKMTVSYVLQSELCAKRHTSISKYLYIEKIFHAIPGSIAWSSNVGECPGITVSSCTGPKM